MILIARPSSKKLSITRVRELALRMLATLWHVEVDAETLSACLGYALHRPSLHILRLLAPVLLLAILLVRARRDMRLLIAKRQHWDRWYMWR